MRIIDYIALGFKNIWRRKSRSFLTIFAVVIGAISMVIMLSLVIGAQNVATQQLESIDGLTLISVSANPEIQSSGNILSTDWSDDETGQKLNDSAVAMIKKMPNVVDATPTAGVWIKNLKLEGQDKKFRANILAYTPDTKALEIPVLVGRKLQAGDMDKIVIGKELLNVYGYSSHPQDIIGKKIILYTQEFVDWGQEPPKPPVNAGEEYWKNLENQPHEIQAEIIGVVTSGPDEGQNYISLDWAKRLMTMKRWEWNNSAGKEYQEMREITTETIKQEMSEEQTDGEKKDIDFDAEVTKRMIKLGYNNSDFQILKSEDNLARSGYSAIIVRVDDTKNIEEVAKNIKNLGFGVSTAKEMLAEIKKIFYFVGLIVGAIGGIVLFVAALGIINNMIMATYERTREIGILRSCGATRRNIKSMFIFEAATLGFLGGVIGLALSFGLAKILNIVGNNIATSQNLPIQDLISFPLWLILGVVGLTTVIGAFSGLFPAIRAAHLDPVEALRYE